jgi:hypothetical protein
MLWVVVFGIFGVIYIKKDPKGDADIQRMKISVWVDLANMVLWLIMAVYAFIVFRRQKARSTNTVVV